MRGERGASSSDDRGVGPAVAVWVIGLVVVLIVPIAAILNSMCGFMVFAGAIVTCDQEASDRANAGALIWQAIGVAVIWTISLAVGRKRRFASGIFWSVISPVILAATWALIESIPQP